MGEKIFIVVLIPSNGKEALLESFFVAVISD